MEIELTRGKFEEFILTKVQNSNYKFPQSVLKRDENGEYCTTWVDMAWMGWCEAIKQFV